MAMTFTREQQEAIDLHGCNILVSAAAGSGKTAVLAERIVEMVCNEEKPVDIDRLLVVTFTNAAAAQMRERIAAGISGRLTESPQSEHIQKQAALLHNAQITTIDSFCLFLLRNHFNEIGLDPAFRIADEGEIKLMQQEVLRELLEDFHASGSEDFRYCVEYFCPGGRESVLEGHILNLSRCAASFPWPAGWLEERKRDYEGEGLKELCESSCARWLTEHLGAVVRGCVEKLETVRTLCLQPDGPYMYGQTVEEELERLEGLLACTSLTEYETGLWGITFGRLPSKKDDSVSADKRELAKEIRAEVKDSIQALAERYFATPLELAARQSGKCRRPVNTLIDLALDFDRRMGEKKQEKKVIDFSDMEHFALDILLDTREGQVRPGPVALEYRQHFEEILIDEYQDSNLVQEYLLMAVSGEEEGRFNRFMVGDVKQSIYKFRLARPELFLEKYNTYKEDEEDGAIRTKERDHARGQKGRTCRRIDLAKNFRSRREVVDTVNSLFGGMMSKETGGVPYDDRAALYPGAEYPENRDCNSELLLAEKPEKNSGTDGRQAEALAIAGKIKELRGSFQVLDKESGRMRGARYSDMVILLRTTSGWDEAFQEVLEQEGIPVYIASKTGYFGAAEVQELLNFLRVLDNPGQDIPLFGVMKSLFGGFTEEETARIRSGRKAGSLYGALKDFARGKEEQGEENPDEAAENGEEETGKDETAEEGSGEKLREKAAAFLEMLDKYRNCTVYLPVRELLTKLVNDFGYLDYVTALPAGSKRRANVEMLFTKASDFEKTSYFGLFHFVRYMEQLEKYDVDYGEAGQLDENADVVRIMSIHKSKGLEFPVVFVSGLGKRFNMQDANQPLILDTDLGLGVDYVDPDRRIRNRTLRRAVLAGKLREDSLAEEMRVFYVAMTRAREKLILTASMEGAAAAAEKAEMIGKAAWQKENSRRRLSYLDFTEAGSYLDFLLPVLSGSPVKVTVTEPTEPQRREFAEQIQLFRRKELLEQAAGLAEEEAGARLAERLNAVYPYEGLAGLYTKTTVSELKIAAMADKDEAAYHTFEEKEVQPYIPGFRRGEEKISGTVRGNAYHRVMELMDFDEVLESAGPAGAEKDYGEYTRLISREALESGVRAFLKKVTEEKRLTEEYCQAVKIKRIVKFLCSEVGYRMWKAHREKTLRREQPFVLGIDARRLKEDFPEGETVLIQGIIDVYFREEDGLVLLDYKTDSVSSMEELWNRYETQMDYYQEALEKLTGRKVKERILYSFHLEKGTAKPSP